MNVEIKPSVAQGQVKAPASKSYAHRLFVCAALSKGQTIIDNITMCDDLRATISCLETLGAKIEIQDGKAVVDGISTIEKVNEHSFFCNESASTLRFLIPLSLLFTENAKFYGEGRLLQRPQTVYEEILNVQNNGDFLQVRGNLEPGKFYLKGDVSSQFITGLLFALPLLKDDSEIILTTPLQSAPYVDITINILSRFGVSVEETQTGWYIKGSQEYKFDNKISCEGDWSNAAFLAAFNLVNGKVEIQGLDRNSLQGDRVYSDYFNEIATSEPMLCVSDCPDLAPILMVCAAIKNGATLTGTNRLKTKESNRGIAMKQEFLKFGVDVEIGDDFIKIPRCNITVPIEPVNCHNDHRIAMSLAFLCSITGGTLIGAECVNKSYPEFFEDIQKLGVDIRII